MGTLNDTFDGTVGSFLESHTSNSGHTWSRVLTGSGDQQIKLDTYNRARAVTNGFAIYLSSFVLDNSYNFDIEFDGINGTGNDAVILHNWNGAFNSLPANGFFTGMRYDAVANRYRNGAAFGYPLWGFTTDNFFYTPSNDSTLNTHAAEGTPFHYKLQRRANTGRVWVGPNAMSLKLIGTFTESQGRDGGHRVGIYAREGNNAWDRLVVRDLNSALTAGALSLGWAKPGKIPVYYHGSEGGTGPYTETLHVSTDSGFTPSAANQIGTFDSTLLIEWAGAVAGTVYYFKAKTVDNVGASATSAQAGYLPAVRPERVMRIYGCGDSIMNLNATNGTDTPTAYWKQPGAPELNDGSFAVCTRAIGMLTTSGYIAISYAQSFAVGGTKTSDWTPGSGNLAALNQTAAAYDADTRYSPTGSEAWTFIELGPNDAFPTANVSVSTYIANMTLIINDQLGRGRKVFIVPPTYLAPAPASTTWWNEASDTLVQSYATALQALDNGTTIRVANPTLIRRKMAARAGDWLTQDGYNLHQNTAGQEAWGTVVAEEFVRVLGLSTTAPTNGANCRCTVDNFLDAGVYEFQMTAAPGSPVGGYPELVGTLEVAAGAQGFIDLPQGAAMRYRRNGAAWVTFNVPTTTSFTLPTSLG